MPSPYHRHNRHCSRKYLAYRWGDCSLDHRDDRYCTTVEIMEASRLYSTSLVEALPLRNSSLLPTTGVEIRGKLNTTHKSAIYCPCLTKNKRRLYCRMQKYNEWVAGQLGWLTKLRNLSNSWGCISKPDRSTVRLGKLDSVA